MKVVNSTPVPVRLDLGELDGTSVKFGMLVAKATFTLNAAGVPELETQQPLPILDRDEDGELGLLPRDTLPRRDSASEVIVVGAAYAPRPVASSWIELRVGPYHRRLRVSGDREWVEPAGGPAITSPAPFQRLDLGWHRAFGGSCKVMLDADTPFELPRRNAGRWRLACPGSGAERSRRRQRWRTESGLGWSTACSFNQSWSE